MYKGISDTLGNEWIVDKTDPGWKNISLLDKAGYKIIMLPIGYLIEQTVDGRIDALVDGMTDRIMRARAVECIKVLRGENPAS